MLKTIGVSSIIIIKKKKSPQVINKLGILLSTNRYHTHIKLMLKVFFLDFLYIYFYFMFSLYFFRNPQLNLRPLFFFDDYLAMFQQISMLLIILLTQKFCQSQVLFTECLQFGQKLFFWLEQQQEVKGKYELKLVVCCLPNNT